MFSQIVRLKKTMGKRTLFVSMQCLYVSMRKECKLFGNSFFQELVRIICTVAGDINLPQQNCCAAVNIYI
jgi:hypothetical protein